MMFIIIYLNIIVVGVLTIRNMYEIMTHRVGYYSIYTHKIDDDDIRSQEAYLFLTLVVCVRIHHITSSL